MRKSRGEQRRVAKWDNQRRGAAVKGFRRVLFFFSMVPRHAGEGDGDEFKSLVGGDVEWGRQDRKEGRVDESKDP